MTGGIDASFGDMIVKKEENNLNKSFRTYELFYFTLITIVYIAAMVMIVPFIKVYTNGITDANYIRPSFAILIVSAELMWAIRLPYSSITLAAGHFRETMVGAWIEAGTNLILSIILVFKFGIIGVTIGTLVAMTIRTIEFIYHTSKYILKRRKIQSVIRVIILILEVVIIVPIEISIIQSIEFESYIKWALIAVIICIINCVIVGIVNSIIYKKDLKELFAMLKRIIKKKEVDV